MLDISIDNLAKNPKAILLHLNDQVLVTEKVDGTKLTLIRTNSPWSENVEDNWIVSYKGNIIHPEDFHGISNTSPVAAHSMGISQYLFVWDGLKKANPRLKNIPTNMEFFIEFVMKKGTLTRSYATYHNMILLAYSPTRYTIAHERLSSTPSGFYTDKLTQYANVLGILTPKVLYSGKVSSLISSIDPIKIIDELNGKFLSTPSQFGGTIEGIVLNFSSGAVMKLVQDDQYDKATRAAIKKSLAPSSEDYWGIVRAKAEFFITKMRFMDVKDDLSRLSKLVYSGLIDIHDSNKKDIQIKDDVYLTAKTMLLKRFPGNNGALFIGRMSPLTIAHHTIISNALSQYDSVSVCLIKAKLDEKNPFSIDIQTRMLKACFGNRIEVLTSTTGTIHSIIPKSKHNINIILAGTDRVDGYKSQIRTNKDLQIVEIPRTDDVSATRVRSYLKSGDQENFKKLTPPPIHLFYDELKKSIQEV